MFFSSRRKEPKAARGRQSEQAGVAAPDPRTHIGVAGQTCLTPKLPRGGEPQRYGGCAWHWVPCRAHSRVSSPQVCCAYVRYHGCRGELCSPACFNFRRATFLAHCRGDYEPPVNDAVWHSRQMVRRAPSQSPEGDSSPKGGAKVVSQVTLGSLQQSGERSSPLRTPIHFVGRGLAPAVTQHTSPLRARKYLRQQSETAGASPRPTYAKMQR